MYWSVLKEQPGTKYKSEPAPSNFIITRYHGGGKKTSSATHCSLHFSRPYLASVEVVANISINTEWINWHSKLSSGRCKYYFGRKKLTSWLCKTFSNWNWKNKWKINVWNTSNSLWYTIKSQKQQWKDIGNKHAWIANWSYDQWNVFKTQNSFM